MSNGNRGGFEQLLNLGQKHLGPWEGFGADKGSDIVPTLSAKFHSEIWRDLACYSARRIRKNTALRKRATAR